MSHCQSDAMMVNGSVGLIGLDSERRCWATKLLAPIEVAGSLAYQLESCLDLSGRVQKYQLLDNNKRLVEEWCFLSHWGKTTMNVNGERSQRFKKPGKLEYRIGLFGGKTFITSAGKKKLYMNLTDYSRAYDLEGMFFKHVDYQSKIHFRCPQDRLHQAIMVANLLFNLPMRSDLEVHSNLSILSFS